VQRNIRVWNINNKHCYFVNANGEIVCDKISPQYNNAPRNILAAEIILMMLRRLSLMYNKGKEAKYFIITGNNVDSLKISNTLNYTCTEPTFASEYLAKKAIKEIGKEKLIFMFQNLQKL
jgi:hypothetical protein